MRAKITVCISLLFMVVMFQNCGRGPQAEIAANRINATAAQAPKEEVVVDETAGMEQIEFDSVLNAAISVGTAPSAPGDSNSIAASYRYLTVSLSDGTYTMSDPHKATKFYCSLSSQQKETLKSLLSVSQVCQAAPGSEEEHCLAVPMGEDIVLSNHQKRVGLEKVVCQKGTYLCDGNDEKLRAQLTLLKKPLNGACAERKSD